jgi:uncharacterized phiE125 gp8 family phage protein
MRYRSLLRLTQPSVEPVSVSEARHHLRVDDDTDNTYIASLIAVARELAEGELDRTLLTTQWQMKLDGFPAGDIELPRPPMSVIQTSVVVTYTPSDGTISTLPATQYRVDTASTPGVVRPLYSGTWPAFIIDANSVTITWWAGYGNDGASVPAVVKNAMLLTLTELYENRSATKMPEAAKALLSAAKWGSYR